MRRGWLRRNRQGTLWWSQRVSFVKPRRVAGAARPRTLLPAVFAGSHKSRRLSARLECISMVNPPSGGLGLGNAKIGGPARRTLWVVCRTVIHGPPVSQLARSGSTRASPGDRSCGSNRCLVYTRGAWPAWGRAWEVPLRAHRRADTARHPAADSGTLPGWTRPAGTGLLHGPCATLPEPSVGRSDRT